VFDPVVENVVSLPTGYTLYVWSANSDTWRISTSLQTALVLLLSESLAITMGCSSRSAIDCSNAENKACKSRCSEGEERGPG